MRWLPFVLLVSGSIFAADKSCIIANQHQAKMSENLIRWTPARAYDYVEGQYPKGMKFEHELGNKQIQKLQSLGGKMVVLKQEYSPAELEDARKQCRAFQESKP